jgi:uncharacterized protein YcaQ
MQREALSTVNLSEQMARRYLLAYHGLWPAYSAKSKGDVLAYFRRVGCIQFDPINVVARNADLVLQSRVDGYSPAMLDSLLYQDRLLLDGWDKVQSIYRATDWPYFSRLRRHNTDQPWHEHEAVTGVAGQVLAAIRERGPLCSLDLEHVEMVNGFWGVPMRTGRGALENLYNMGAIGIHHRVGTRRYFDIIERLIPEPLLQREDPFEDEQSYHDWHVLRRAGGLGLAMPASGEGWGGMLKIKSPQRLAALERLTARGALVKIAVAGQPEKNGLYTPATACEAFLEAASLQPDETQIAFIAPLDNLIWQRPLLRSLFHFDYTWDVYKPAELRQYGFYVLPVLYGDRFIARTDLAFNRKADVLEVRGWWWEADITPGPQLYQAVQAGLNRFQRMLGAGGLDFVGEQVALPRALLPASA